MRKSLLLGVGLFVGCASSTEPGLFIAAATAELQYARGGTAVVRFANISQETLNYNACAADLQRQGSDGWETVSRAMGEVPCLDNLFQLAPNAVDSVSFPVMVSLTPGAYRYVFTGFRRSNGGTIDPSASPTNAFQVM